MEAHRIQRGIQGKTWLIRKILTEQTGHTHRNRRGHRQRADIGQNNKLYTRHIEYQAYKRLRRIAEAYTGHTHRAYTQGRIAEAYKRHTQLLQGLSNTEDTQQT